MANPIYPNHFLAPQKLTQHCKSTILQKKKKLRKKRTTSRQKETRSTHLNLQACLEADAIRDGRLEFGNGVILLLHLGWDGRLGQVETSRLVQLNTVLNPV